MSFKLHKKNVATWFDFTVPFFHQCEKPVNMCLTSCKVYHHSNKSVSVFLDINLNCEGVTDILRSDPRGGGFCRGCQTRVRCASVPRQQYLHRTRPGFFFTGLLAPFREEFDLRPNVWISVAVSSLRCRCRVHPVRSCTRFCAQYPDFTLKVWP